MRILLSFCLISLAGCSEEAQKPKAEAPVTTDGSAPSSELESGAKSIEEAADKAAALVEAESRKEIEAMRPKAINLENAPQ